MLQSQSTDVADGDALGTLDAMLTGRRARSVVEAKSDVLMLFDAGVALRSRRRNDDDGAVAPVAAAASALPVEENRLRCGDGCVCDGDGDDDVVVDWRRCTVGGISAC